MSRSFKTTFPYSCRAKNSPKKTRFNSNHLSNDVGAYGNVSFRLLFFNVFFFRPTISILIGGRCWDHFRSPRTPSIWINAGSALFAFRFRPPVQYWWPRPRPSAGKQTFASALQLLNARVQRPKGKQRIPSEIGDSSFSLLFFVFNFFLCVCVSLPANRDGVARRRWRRQHKPTPPPQKKNRRKSRKRKRRKWGEQERTKRRSSFVSAFSRSWWPAIVACLPSRRDARIDCLPTAVSKWIFSFYRISRNCC